MKLHIKSTTRLTEAGRLGAFLFVVGPLAASLFSFMYFSTPARSYGSPEKDTFLVLTVAGAVAFLIGYILLSVGKETVSIAITGDDVDKKSAP